MADAEQELALLHLLAPVARGWRQMGDTALAQFGVSSSAGWCLVHLDRLEEPPRQAELALLLDISPPSLVRTLDQLQIAGWIERIADPDDKRSNRLALTDAGKALAEKIAVRLADVRAGLLGGLPDGAVEVGVELLGLLNLRMAEQRGGLG